VIVLAGVRVVTRGVTQGIRLAEIPLNGQGVRETTGTKNELPRERDVTRARGTSKGTVCWT
jgi:hypothetical protein